MTDAGRAGPRRAYPGSESDALTKIIKMLRPYLVSAPGYAGGGYVEFAPQHRCSFGGFARDLRDGLQRAAP